MTSKKAQSVDYTWESRGTNVLSLQNALYTPYYNNVVIEKSTKEKAK